LLNTNLTRVILSAAVVAAYRLANSAHEVVSPLVSGPMAAQQLTDSNIAYIGAQVSSRMFDGSGLSIVILFAVLASIWYKPVKSLFTSNEKVN